MIAGLSRQLVQHQGEYLVAAELCRQGYLATTFTGNVPDFDIIAIDEKLRAIPIQVKAIKAGAWQFDAERFLKIDKEKGVQRISGKEKLRNPKLVWVFIYLEDEQIPEFYLLTEKKVRDIIFRHYSRNLEAKEGRRPRNPESTHTAISRKMLQRYKDNWAIISDVYIARYLFLLIFLYYSDIILNTYYAGLLSRYEKEAPA